MSKLISIQVNKAAVVEAIKGDTSITGNVDRSIDAVKNAGVAYNEQAGDDAYHLKKIDLQIRTAVSKFAAEMTAFADGTEGSVTTNVGDTITINMKVSDRYMSGLADPLAGIAQSYIVYMSLYGWWISIKPEFAKGFATMAADALAYVHKCFAKAAPTASRYSYEDVTGTCTDGRTPAIIGFNQESGKIWVGDTPTPFAVTTNPAGLPLTYSSNSPMVATVDSSGNVTAVAPGTAIITATFAGNNDYFPATASITITVLAAKLATTVTIAQPGTIQRQPQVGKTISFKATTTPVDGLPVEFSFDDIRKVGTTATLSPGNIVNFTPQEEGDLTITGTFEGNDQYQPSTGSKLINILPAGN